MRWIVKASIGCTILKNQIRKFNILAKCVRSIEVTPVIEQYEVNWQDYYQILQVSPNAEPKAITVAYKRLAHLYHHLLSKMPEVSAYSERMNNINEAYGVLSDPVRRAAYEQVFKAKYNSQEIRTEEPTKEEIIDLMALITQEVSKKEARKIWRILGRSKLVQRVILIAAISLLMIIAGGTSLAFAKPEYAVASPFKGVAITMTEASAAAISLIEDIRGVVATYERNIVSTTLQSMRVIENLRWVPPVTVSTNDMARFPSQQHPLFPDYLDKRFSQFKYTVDSQGIVTVDTSGSTTDTLLEKINQLLNRLTEGK